MTKNKEKNNKDLIKTLNEKREVLRKFRFGISGSKTRDVKEGKNTRKEVAQILTELNSRK
ncbi:MAG TPA: 50S ribosomal protein L29 [Candidatus Kaiserbacteria bacterium]|nr:50S ribosomal protein L29 [Candidatus Kaiserbacteria bacterium]